MKSQDGGAEVQLQELRKTFGGNLVVDSVNLTIAPGEFFALLGSSGCGKTTTLRMIAGLETPSSGRILLDGSDVVGVPPAKRQVNTVFQNYALFPHLSIRENVAFGLRRRREANIDARVTEMLKMVRMEERAEFLPEQLSGGQKQRIALARALVNNPRALLLDEPLGALDMWLRRDMQLELKQMQTRLGMTFIHVTHDQEEAMSLADRIAVMNSGNIEQIGSPRELYDSPRTKFVAQFLGISNLIPAERLANGNVSVLGIERTMPADRVHHPRGAGWLGVRPEKVRLAEPTDHGNSGSDEARVRGVVTAVAFQGATIQYRVMGGDGTTLQAFEQNLGTEPLRVGDQVDATWNCRDAFFVGDDDVPTAAAA